MKIIFTILLVIICSFISKADWVNVTNEINNLNINALTATDGYIFAGNDQYTYRSSNNGNNWQQIYNLSSLALASNGSYIYRGYQNGYNYSTNCPLCRCSHSLANPKHPVVGLVTNNKN